MTTGGGDGASDGGGPSVWEADRGYLPASWDLEADVVVIGAGATGLPAAIAAIDAGASVLIVEANYDIGGHAILSGGNIPLGGGTSGKSGRRCPVADLRRKIPAASRPGGKADRIQEGGVLGSARADQQGRLGNDAGH